MQPTSFVLGPIRRSASCMFSVPSSLIGIERSFALPSCMEQDGPVATCTGQLRPDHSESGLPQEAHDGGKSLALHSLTPQET
jgi:hypothetical protein